MTYTSAAAWAFRRSACLSTAQSRKGIYGNTKEESGSERSRDGVVFNGWPFVVFETGKHARIRKESEAGPQRHRSRIRRPRDRYGYRNGCPDHCALHVVS